jgi:hypothetical protein
MASKTSIAFLKASLIHRLGGKCEICGSTESLEFDHPNGRNWQPRDLSSYSRLLKYREELDADPKSLRLLCSTHNHKEHPPRCRCVICRNTEPEDTNS